MGLLNIVTCLLFVCVGEQFAHDICSVGSYGCIDIARYIGRQYATCLTDVYIQEFSGFRHHCIDRTDTSCWYQCMMETHDKNGGIVTPDCSCDQLNTTPADDLPGECYSPSGADCNWYIECLEKRYPCRNDPASYAVDFAQRFCLLYSKHYISFSKKGKTWVDAVRKCLQVKLVPTLRPGQHKTCKELRDFAFGTHTECYLSPDDRRLSVCNLDVTDFLEIVWTIKEGFAEVDNAAAALRPTFVQMLSVGKKCFGNLIDHVKMEAVQLFISINPFISDEIKNQTWQRYQERHGDKRSLPDGDIVSEATNQIAAAMQWAEQDLMWFGFPARVKDEINGTGQSSLTIRILVAAKGMYDLNAENVSVANVSVAIDDLSRAIERGEFKFDLGKGKTAELYSVCSDIDCGNSTFEVVPQNVVRPDKQDENDGNLLRNVVIGCGVGIVLVIIVGVVVYKLRK